jgi:hypothetical protein
VVEAGRLGIGSPCESYNQRSSSDARAAQRNIGWYPTGMWISFAVLAPDPLYETEGARRRTTPTER